MTNIIHFGATFIVFAAVLIQPFHDAFAGDGISDTLYKDPHGFFQIFPPNGWKVKEYPGDPRGKVKFSAPNNSNVSLLVIGMATEMRTMDEIIASGKEDRARLTEKYRQFSPTSSETIIEWDGQPAVQGSFSIPNRFQTQSLEFLHGNQYYMLSFAAPPALFQNYEAIVRQSIKSIDPIPRDLTSKEARAHLAASKLRVAELNLQLGRKDLALRTVNDGLAIDPGNKKLLGLREELTEPKAKVDRRMREGLPREIPARSELIAQDAEQRNGTSELAQTGKVSIMVLPFDREDRYEQRVSWIVSADLRRSGLFRLGGPGNANPLPTQAGDVDYEYWRNEKVQNLVVGNVTHRSDGHADVQFRMFDVGTESQIVGYAFRVQVSQLRATAHKIADLIYEKLTGHAGVFGTKICYVVKRGETFELQIADADGLNPMVIHRYNTPVMSPQWSPDGRRVAYVSFEQSRPIVYILNVYEGKRQVLAAFKGANSAPAWSPDGRRLAVTLDKDGISQLYLINADGTGEYRVTHSESIETDPNFSPDGKFLLFTSYRAGSPQIYRVRVDGSGEPERMTFEGEYNVTPRYSPDGKSFVYVHRNQGRDNIAVQNIETKQVQILTSGRVDQSPTFAPNGKMVLYATEFEGRGILALVSSDGHVKQRITAQVGDLGEPAWGPLLDPQMIRSFDATVTDR